MIPPTPLEASVEDLVKSKLAIAVFQADRPAYRIAAEVGMTETRFNRITAGRIAATKDERNRIAAALNTNVAALFEDEQPAP